MIERYFKRRRHCPNSPNRLIGLILIAGGAILVLIYIPVWAWMAVFGIFLVVLGIFILMGWRW